MTLAEIISLSNAGFTKDDIIKLAGIPAPAAPAPAAPAAPAPAAPAAPAPTAPAAQPSTELLELLNKIQSASISESLADPDPAPAPAAQHSAEMAEILAAIRGANIASMPGPDPVQTPSTDDVLATIINPFGKPEDK